MDTDKILKDVDAYRAILRCKTDNDLIQYALHVQLGNPAAQELAHRLARAHARIAELEDLNLRLQNRNILED